MPAIDPNCKLLIHADGADASTSFPDSSGTGKVVTANGNAQVDTAKSKFGGASALFDGNGDYLSTPDNADWDFPGDFTIDFWTILAEVGTGVYDHLVGNASLEVGSDGWAIGVQDPGNLRFSAMYSAGSWAINQQYSHGIPANTLAHIAIVRSGTTIYFFIDGIIVGTITNNPVTSITGSNPLQIGKDPSGTLFQLNGWIDELNIVKGVALWTANFVPPALPYGTLPSGEMNESFFI